MTYRAKGGYFLAKVVLDLPMKVLGFVTLALLRPYNICLTWGSNSQPHYDNSHY